MALVDHGNFIFTKASGLPKLLCKKIITQFDQAADKKRGETVGGLQAKVKHSLDLRIEPSMQSWDETWQPIDAAIHSATKQLYFEYIKKYDVLKNLPVKDTGYQIQRYPAGLGKYEWHPDNLAGATQNRQISMVMYLNSVAKGGETEFRYLGTKIQPEAGKILVFPPFWTHFHRGSIPVSNDKYIITTFFVLD